MIYHKIKNEESSKLGHFLTFLRSCFTKCSKNAPALFPLFQKNSSWPMPCSYSISSKRIIIRWPVYHIGLRSYGWQITYCVQAILWRKGSPHCRKCTTAENTTIYHYWGTAGWVVVAEFNGSPYATSGSYKAYQSLYVFCFEQQMQQVAKFTPPKMQWLAISIP